MKYIALGLGAIGVFIVGFEAGGNFATESIKKDLEEKSSLVIKSLTDTFTAVGNGTLTEEAEIAAKLKSDLEFVQIVTQK